MHPAYCPEPSAPSRAESALEAHNLKDRASWDETGLGPLSAPPATSP